MKMAIFHQVIAGTGNQERLTAFEEESIARVEELEMGTAIYPGEKGPVLVKEKFKEVMEELGQKVPEEKPKPGQPEPKPHEPPHPDVSSRGKGTR